MNFYPVVGFVAAPAAERQVLQHNLSFATNRFYVVQFIDGISIALSMVVIDGDLSIPLGGVSAGSSYKVIAYGVEDGVADGIWWVDNWVYDPGQVNIEFTSQGQGGGSGELKTFTGVVEVSGNPAARQVVAVGLDGAALQLLAATQSDPVTGQYTLQWQGYSGQILVTALDDYGVAHVTGEARGVGERIQPGVPTGYVYQVSSAGELGAEPAWPTTEGATVISGTVVMTAVPYYRPKSAGPFTV